jgi:2,4-diaminopentanoate dehydrogenase
MPRRVIQYGTGFVGTHALRGILTDPALELVGLVVHSEDKAGQDAGTMCGLDPVGVTATTDVDRMLGVEADVFAYFGAADFANPPAELLARMLASGKNVVSTAISELIYPPAARVMIREQIEQGCRDGSTTYFGTGIEPGFFSDYLPVAMTGCSRRIDSVRVYELATYGSGTNSDAVAFDIFGFGGPLDPPPPITTPDGLLANWGGVVAQLAEQLGLRLDEITTHAELNPAEETFDYQGRTIEAGTLSAVHFEIVGTADGEPRVAVEHVTRTRDQEAPEWVRPLAGDSYRIVIEGSPRLECEVQFDEDGDGLAGAYNITAMRALNAIPAVCEAAPGIVTPFDLPLIKGRFATGKPA